MELNETGKIIDNWIDQISKRFPSTKINSLQIMPNHIHLIIQIVGAIHESPLLVNQNNFIRSPFKRDLLSLVIGYFKMNTTKIIREQKLLRSEKLWQRNYYEHIIRNQEDLIKHQYYILDNPKNWYLDKEHPKNLKIKN